jgi:hypothetical protein
LLSFFLVEQFFIRIYFKLLNIFMVQFLYEKKKNNDATF